MSRKGENIYLRKDGRWEGRYIKGRRADGKIHYGSIYGSKYSEVKERLILLKAEYAKRLPIVGDSGLTVCEWLTYWLDFLAKPYIRESTYASYRNKIEKHMIPFFGAHKLQKISEHEIQLFVDALLYKGLKGSTVRVIYRILSTACSKAVSKNHLAVNPCENIILPSVAKAKHKALTINEQKMLEYQALHSKGNEGIIIALYTGMRIGEVSALTWEDIDFIQDLIFVRQTLQRVSHYRELNEKTQIVVNIPKTSMSYRESPLVGHLRAYLLELKKKSNNKYVVTCKHSYAEPRTITYRFKQLIGQLDIRDATFHSLRHTFATRCIEKGIDIATLSHLLGHSSIKMTLDVYADSTMSQRKRAMLTLDQLFGDEKIYNITNKPNSSISEETAWY